MEDLPTPPSGAMMVVRAASDPDVSIQRIGAMLETEPNLTTMLLRLANSAAYGVGRPVRTVRQAASFLGVRTIRNIAVNYAVRSTMNTVDTGAFDAEQFWEDSLRRGTAARVLASRAGYPDGGEAFTLGLIQDLGSMLMAVRYPDKSEGLQKASREPAADRLETERRLTGTTHPALLSEVGTSWGLPEDLLRVIAAHHDEGMNLPTRREQRLLSICHAADAVADVVQTHAAMGSREHAQLVVTAMRSREPLELEAIVDEVAVEMAVAARELEISIGEQPSFEELMSRANEVLIDINERYEHLIREKEELLRRLEQTVAEKESLARKLQASNDLLRRIAATDMLTGVANRRAFTEALEAAVTDAREANKPLTLVMLDIDHFKKVNDTWGHGAGDEVLKEVCNRLAGAIRPTDLLGRLGGEEFGILLKECDQPRGRMIAERMRTAVKNGPVVHEGTRIRVAASFGGISRRGSAIPSVTELMSISDTLLYQSKRGGRDRVTFDR
jgi:two-component system, cell cycle response regulator